MLLLAANLEAFKGSTHINCSEFSTTHPLQPYSVLPFAEASAEMSSLTNLQHNFGSSPHNEDLLLATPWGPENSALSALQPTGIDLLHHVWMTFL